jgi:hypothetical protein
MERPKCKQQDPSEEPWCTMLGWFNDRAVQPWQPARCERSSRASLSETAHLCGVQPLRHQLRQCLWRRQRQGRRQQGGKRDRQALSKALTPLETQANYLALVLCRQQGQVSQEAGLSSIHAHYLDLLKLGFQFMNASTSKKARITAKKPTEYCKPASPTTDQL